MRLLIKKIIFFALITSLSILAVGLVRNFITLERKKMYLEKVKQKLALLNEQTFPDNHAYLKNLKENIALEQHVFRKDLKDCEPGSRDWFEIQTTKNELVNLARRNETFLANNFMAHYEHLLSEGFFFPQQEIGKICRILIEAKPLEVADIVYKDESLLEIQFHGNTQTLHRYIDAISYAGLPWIVCNALAKPSDKKLENITLEAQWGKLLTQPRASIFKISIKRIELLDTKDEFTQSKQRKEVERQQEREARLYFSPPLVTKNDQTGECFLIRKKGEAYKEDQPREDTPLQFSLIGYLEEPSQTTVILESKTTRELLFLNKGACIDDTAFRFARIDSEGFSGAIFYDEKNDREYRVEGIRNLNLDTHNMIPESADFIAQRIDTDNDDT